MNDNTEDTETDSNRTELVVDPARIESVLPMLGYEVSPERTIVSVDTGEVATSPAGEELTIDEVGYLGAENGRVVPIKDDLSQIVAYLADSDADWSDPRDAEDSDTGENRCKGCGAHLWGHEQSFGKCMACRSNHEMEPGDRLDTDSQNDSKTIKLDAAVYERFERERANTKTDHEPEMTPSVFLSVLLDTETAAREGYYNNE